MSTKHVDRATLAKHLKFLSLACEEGRPDSAPVLTHTQVSLDDSQDRIEAIVAAMTSSYFRRRERIHVLLARVDVDGLLLQTAGAQRRVAIFRSQTFGAPYRMPSQEEITNHVHGTVAFAFDFETDRIILVPCS